MENDIIAQYDVYAYDDTETVHDYIGNDLDEAIRSFEMLKSMYTNTETINKAGFILSVIGLCISGVVFVATLFLFGALAATGVAL